MKTITAMGTNFTAPMAGNCNHSIRIIVLYAESFYGTRRSDYDVHIIYRILLEGGFYLYGSQIKLFMQFSYFMSCC